MIKRTLKDINQKQLKKVLKYIPKTGNLIRRTNVSMSKKGDIAGCLNKENGYIYITINYKSYSAHRLAFLYMEGYFPEHQIDHIDRNRSNNKWSNLRHVSNVCNLRNQKVAKNNISGVTGVSWNTKEKKWFSKIKIEKERLWLGSYKSLTKAVHARWKAEVRHDFPNCNTSSAAYLYLQNHKLIK